MYIMPILETIQKNEKNYIYIFNFETSRSICAKDYILVNLNMLPSACQPYPAGHICLGVTVVKQPRHSPLTDFGK